MFRSALRYLVIFALLLVALGLAWQQQRGLAKWFSGAVPTSPVNSSSAAEAAGSRDVGMLDMGGRPELPYLYFVDVEGWYRITPHERVVRSAYDLTGDSTESLGAALPTTLGDWQQVGSDRYLAEDPAVIYYLKHPTVALERTYQDRHGQDLSLTLLGNVGEDSFLLFSHTPETCYPGRLWEVVDQRQASAMVDEQSIFAQYLLTQHAETGEKLMVLYWYLWEDPERNSQEGVLSMRVNLFAAPDQTEDAALSRAWAFIRELFPATVPWERY